MLACHSRIRRCVHAAHARPADALLLYRSGLLVILLPYPLLLTPLPHLCVQLGSCNKVDRPQPFWREIAARAPAAWIWMGDNVYADTKRSWRESLQEHYNRSVRVRRNDWPCVQLHGLLAHLCTNTHENAHTLVSDISYIGQPSTPFGVDSTFFKMANAERIRQQYNQQRQEPGYRKVMETSKICGTWDDHDYGMNDGDRRYPYRDMSQELLLDFLDEPLESPRRRQAGVYAAHTFEVCHTATTSRTSKHTAMRMDCASDSAP